LRPLRKDNAGYALRDLYIGSEGSLGVITAAVLKLFPLPAAQVVAFVAVPSPAAALALLSLAQQRLAADLTAFELVSETCLQLVEQHVDAARRPLAEPSPWYVLLEVSSAQGESAGRGHRSLLEVALDAGHASDAALSASVAQFRSLWALREDISELGRGRRADHQARHRAAHHAHPRLHRGHTDAALARHFPGLRLGGVRPPRRRQPALQRLARRAGVAMADFSVALEAPDQPPGA